jgi:molybdopterin biosynthesis enzyme
MRRREELAASLRRALDTADVVVTTGGMWRAFQ